MRELSLNKNKKFKVLLSGPALHAVEAQML